MTSLPVAWDFLNVSNDKEAAFMLFDACRDWIREQGLEAMDGPINFGDRDKWWGLLVDGFNHRAELQLQL